ncbi:MAG TPA: type I restriction enzyme endonuclease domain-containing protein, partial [bacterium]|nr:type I restriction enzyme endonuclease domain-containing protein [bacterium]
MDYVGIGRELAEALVIFEKEDLEGIFRVDDIQKGLADLAYWHQQALGFFDRVDRFRGKPEDILQRCMEILRPEDVRADFDAAFQNMARSMDFLMPDPVVAPYLDDFKFLGAVREGARNLYRDERLSLVLCSQKVEALINAHIAETGIEQLLEPINITAPDFREKLEMKGSPKAKASHVEYAIRQTIEEKIATDPAFYGSLKERLEKVIEEDRKERQDEAKLLLDLMEFANQDKRREAYAKSIGLEDLGEFALYGLFTPFRNALFSGSEKEQVAFTQMVIQTIEEKTVIDWTEKEDIKKEMRREIRRLLKTKGCLEDRIEVL